MGRGRVGKGYGRVRAGQGLEISSKFLKNSYYK
jgi:hypothetical protein